jgi:hypothetical protein
LTTDICRLADIDNDFAVSSLDERGVAAAISYLDRNDFTKIVRVTGHVLKADDGSRHVYVWLDAGPLDRIRVPPLLDRLAKVDRARLDVIVIHVTGDKASLKHVMNV